VTRSPPGLPFTEGVSQNPTGPKPAALADARRLLRLREGACPAEIRTAFRAAIREMRPDVGGSTAEQLDELRAARELLLAAAGRDRRRHSREESRYDNPALLRKATWGLDDGGGSRISTVL
jgi:curved DNA-binding protein CbpA